MIPGRLGPRARGAGDLPDPLTPRGMELPRRIDAVDALLERYPDLPPEAIFKEDLLRIGVDLSDGALRIAASSKPKSYFISVSYTHLTLPTKRIV